MNKVYLIKKRERGRKRANREKKIVNRGGKIRIESEEGVNAVLICMFLDNLLLAKTNSFFNGHCQFSHQGLVGFVRRHIDTIETV